tara:strand:- start:300 stop:545 length:246 start_codon:yes stop_codon:yes gene_type:complete
VTRKEYDQILDVFSMAAKGIDLGREDNWKAYKNDEPKELIVELSIRLGAVAFRQVTAPKAGGRNPFTDRDGLDCFSPEELN